MSKKGHDAVGNTPRKKSKAASYFVRILAAVLGLAVGFCLYWIYIFGGTFVSVPVVNKEDYTALQSHLLFLQFHTEKHCFRSMQ